MATTQQLQKINAVRGVDPIFQRLRTRAAQLVPMHKRVIACFQVMKESQESVRTLIERLSPRRPIGTKEEAVHDLLTLARASCVFPRQRATTGTWAARRRASSRS